MQLALCEVEEFGFTSVGGSSAGPQWNFYAWNSIKHKFPKEKAPNMNPTSQSVSPASTICIIC